MKGIVLIVLVVVIGIFCFSSCSNKVSHDEYFYYNALVGDCISDSIFQNVKLELEKLNWLDDSIYNYGKTVNYIISKMIINYSKIDSLTTKEFSTWFISIKDYKLKASNSSQTYMGLYNFSNGSKEIYKDLSTNKKDTSFWNVVEILNKYCSVRDSIQMGTTTLILDGKW